MSPSEQVGRVLLRPEEVGQALGDRADDGVRVDAVGRVAVGEDRQVAPHPRRGGDRVRRRSQRLSPSFRQLVEVAMAPDVRASGSPRPTACGCSARPRTRRGRSTGRRTAGGVRRGGCRARSGPARPPARRSRRRSSVGRSVRSRPASSSAAAHGRGPGGLVAAQRAPPGGAAVVVGQVRGSCPADQGDAGRAAGGRARLPGASPSGRPSSLATLAPRTVRHHRQTLAQVVDEAVKMGALVGNPVRAVKPLRVTDSGGVALDRDETGRCSPRSRTIGSARRLRCCSCRAGGSPRCSAWRGRTSTSTPAPPRCGGRRCTSTAGVSSSGRPRRRAPGASTG